MAEAVISIALETLRDLLLEEARLLHGVSDEVKGLQTQLTEMKCLLEDADKRQHEIKTVLNWIAEIRDLACRAEDAIETYAFHVCSSKRGRGLKRLLRRFSCILINEGYTLHKIGSEISEIKSELARVTKSMQDFGISSIIQGETSNDNQSWKRQTFPYEIEEDFFVGKDEELKQLVSLIVDDDKEHRVVSVWGMGGLGKTTIARKVYNHNRTRSSFGSFAWICITQQCVIRSVLVEILKQLIQHPTEGISQLSLERQTVDISSLSNTDLIGQLCQIQKAKRCMIVLDDLWEVDHWVGLKHALLVEGSNSKILLTTRKQVVADMGFLFELGLIDIDDGLELLKKKAFSHGSTPVEEKFLQSVGKEMVRKCGRPPLVISLLGGVLSRKKSAKEWELVNDNINAYLEKEKETHGILNLSYGDLPNYLKPCFLFMGQFREDESISINNLYKLWIAKGMVSNENQQGNGGSLMDVAELYLSELASRCIVQVKFKDVGEDKYETCKLHDVVRELCLLKGQQENFGCKVIEYKGGNFSNLLHESLSSTKTRHLSIHFEGKMEMEPLAMSHADTRKNVRSLQFLNYLNANAIEFPDNSVDFGKLRLLRILVFENFDFAGGKLPRGIDNLIHLRYLRFRRCKLNKLPSSIGNLIYLYCLDLRYSRDVRVPNVCKKMTRLRHLLLPYYGKGKLRHCQLRLEGLDELETLSGFNSLVHDLKSLIKMKNLRYFSAVVYDNESLSAVIGAMTTNWKNLRYSEIRIRQDCQFTLTEEGFMILKNLLACPNLQYLNIMDVHIRKLPEECETQMMISRISTLVLQGCEIEDDPMKMLGKLPVLEKLRLARGTFVGEEMKCHANGFPRLRILGLCFLPNLRRWIVEQEAMPVLVHIVIETCLLLEMVPDGLRSIRTLEILRIVNMPNEFGKRLLASPDEGEDFDKVRHVSSIVIVDDQ